MGRDRDRARAQVAASSEACVLLAPRISKNDDAPIRKRVFDETRTRAPPKNFARAKAPPASRSIGGECKNSEARFFRPGHVFECVFFREECSETWTPLKTRERESGRPFLAGAASEESSTFAEIRRDGA